MDNELINATLTLTVTVTCLSVLFCLYYRWKHRRYYELMGKIPTLPTLPILGNAHLLPRSARGAVVFLTKMLLEHPLCIPLAFWMGPFFAVVNIANPQHLQILLTNPDALYKGRLARNLGQIWLGDGLVVTQNKTKWRTHRKVITSTFTPKILDSFMEVFVSQTNILVDCLKKELGKDEAFDMLKYTMPASFDTICGTAMGITVNSQTQNSPFFDAANSQFFLIQQRVQHIWTIPEFTFKFSKNYKLQQRNQKIINGFSDEVIKEKKRLLKEKQDDANNNEEPVGFGRNPGQKVFLDYLLEQVEEKGWTLEDIRDEVNFFIAAGYETTSTTVAFVLMSLAFHPKIQDKVYEELYSIFGDSARDVRTDDLPKMTYLEMVIKETLRMYSTLPVNLRYLDSDIDLGSYVLPKGAYVMVWMQHVHRNPEIWPNPDRFDPERFTAENVAKRHPYSYIPFSAGQRQCLGYRYSMMAMKVTLSAILRAYRVTSPIRKRNFRVKLAITLKTNDGFMMNIHPRNG